MNVDTMRVLQSPGLNFPFYVPGKVERVEAVEPDPAMLRYAGERHVSCHQGQSSGQKQG